MKKLVSVLLSLLMMAGAVALAEDTSTEVFDSLVGRITEIDEDTMTYHLTLLDGSELLVLTDENTATQADWVLGVGDVVSVFTDGSAPAGDPLEVTAEGIASFSVEGQVTEVDADGNRVLINAPSTGEVWMLLPDGEKAEDYAGLPVRVFFNGIMALSLPAQATAYTIDAMSLETGVVTEIGNGFFLIEAVESEYRVNYDQHSKQIGELNIGDDVQVFYDGISTRSLPPQIFGAVVIKVEVVG